MTIINGIEIKLSKDYYNKRGNLQKVLQNNTPIESQLHIIAVIFNPCNYERRYELMHNFINHIEENENAILYIVELAYGNNPFVITKSNNSKHLQLRSESTISTTESTNESTNESTTESTDESILWSKESLINVGVKKLLPADWKAFAWIDADITFDSVSWIDNTLRLLKGAYDILQLFSHCIDMDKKNSTMKVFNSAGYQYSKNLPFSNKGENSWHPGYAWAITKTAYERIGGLYDKAILGSGDNIMMLSIIGHGLKAINDESTQSYKNSVINFEKKIKTLRFGYTPTVILHNYHGSKKMRGYSTRWKLLVEHNYSPDEHIVYDKNGLISMSKKFPIELKNEILKYFISREEDS